MTELGSLFDIYYVMVLIIPGFLAWRITRLVCPSKQHEFTKFESTIYCLAYTLPIFASFNFWTNIKDINELRTHIFVPDNIVILLILAVLWGTATGLSIRAFREIGKWWKKRKGISEPTTEESISEPVDEYLVEEANDLAEAKNLLKQGYEYAAEVYGKKLFRKHK